MVHDGQDASRSSWIALALEMLTRGACRWPKITLCLVVASMAACGAYAWRTLTIKTNRADLINPEAPYQVRWRRYADAFDDVTEDLVVVVEGRTRESILSALDDLGPRVERDSQYFRNVLYRIDLRAIVSKGLQFLPTQELEKLAIKLRKFRMLAAVAPNSAIERRMDADAEAQATASAQLVQQIEPLTDAWKGWNALPAAQRELVIRETSELIGQMTRSETASEAQDLEPKSATPQSTTALGGGVRYLLNSRGTLGFLQAQPVIAAQTLSGAAAPVARMRTLIQVIQKRHPDTRIGLTGVPVLEHDEMVQSQSEMMEAAVLSFFGVAFVLFAGFRRLRHPLLGMVMLLVGTSWSFAAAALAVGHLNILSIAFAAMLFGLGNDFAIVYISHYAEQRERGLPLFEALLDASRSVGPGITTAATTGAAAFFAAVLTDFTGIAELGLIAGWGLLLCNLLTFIFIPPALLLCDRNWSPPEPTAAAPRRPSVRWRGAMSLAVFVVALAAVGQFAPQVRYDTNLLNMQAAGTEAMLVQQRIEQQSEDSLLYAVSLAKNRQTALDLKRRFEALPTVSRVEEIASLLPPQQTPRRQALIETITRAAGRLAELQSSIPNPSRVGAALENLHAAIAAVHEPAAGETEGALDQFLDQLSALPLNEQIQLLMPARGAIPAELASLGSGEANKPITLADLPSSFASRFVGRDSQWLLKVYPREAVWDGAPLSRFVEDVRGVDPDVTGTPLQNFEASQAIWDSYLEAGLYALIAVTILLWWDFRTLHETLLALSPAACAMLLTLGVLGYWHMALNPANMIMLPLLLGLGVDGGVHVLHDYRSQRDGYRMSPSTARSILLTATTSIVGFGSLMVASHRGLFSLGFVLAVGVTGALTTALIALPSLLSLITPPPADLTAAATTPPGDSDAQQPGDRSAA